MPQSEIEKEIIKLSADKFSWYTDGKINNIENLYDDSLIFIHMTGHASNKKEWINEIRSRNFIYNQINIRDASAKAYCNTVVLVGKATFIVNGGNKYNLVYTEVYTKKGDQWKLMNIHTCSSGD